jgi:hypothetical protein
MLCVGNFRQTGSALKQKSSGRPHSVRTPENIAAVRQAVATSPQRSVVKNALALGISERSVRRVLQADLKFHPYKMMVVQELRNVTGSTAKHPTRPSWKIFQLTLMCSLVTGFRVRLEECIAREGKHLDDIIFKTK